ncbi:MAG: septation protein IspZ, partial [Rickettsiaceae bacterium]|nr:septation protein IspZ [Rickettsiaceae bacterium]
LVSSALLLVSASLTLFSGNAIFIKMKPTLFYFIFAVILFITNFREKTAIEFVFGKTISFKKSIHWKKLNLRFALFFIIMAIFNEIIWRNFPEDIWVNFKVFGALPITLVFIMSQIPFIMRHQKSI